MTSQKSVTDPCAPLSFAARYIDPRPDANPPLDLAACVCPAGPVEPLGHLIRCAMSLIDDNDALAEGPSSSSSSSSAGGGSASSGAAFTKVTALHLGAVLCRRHGIPALIVYFWC